MMKTKEERLLERHNRATRYEIVAYGTGIDRFLVGYTARKSRDGLLTTMRGRSDLIEKLAIGEEEKVRFETQPITAAIFGDNRGKRRGIIKIEVFENGTVNGPMRITASSAPRFEGLLMPCRS